jgi:Rho-type GTPase-activating protein 1/2
MARRRKKSRAAANAKKKEEQSPMLVDKSLPALPPSAAPPSAFTPDEETPPSLDNATPTELSPRPRQGYQNESSSRSSSRPPRDRSPAGRPSNDGPNLTLPTTTYRNNRHSVISHDSDLNGGDGESFFIPLALDPSPAPAPLNGSRAPSETWADPVKKNKENKAPEREHLPARLKTRNDSRTREASSSSPHIAFQDKGRQPSSEDASNVKESLRKAQSRSGTTTKKDSPSIDDTRVQHVNSPSTTNNTRSQMSGEKFRLGEVPKGKRAGSRTESQSEGNSGENTSRASPVGLSAFPYRRETPTSASKTDPSKPPAAPERASTPQPSQDLKPKEEESRVSAESTDSAPAPRADTGVANKSIPRKEIGTGLASNIVSSMSSSSSTGTSPSSSSSSDTPSAAPTLHGKPISAPLNTLLLADDLAPHGRTPTRPAGPPHQTSNTYMAPRAAPPAPSQLSAKDQQGPPNGTPISPVLPRWSAGGDFTMDEDMARILGGTDETSQSILRRVSNAVRHGRTGSEVSVAARHAGHARSISETTAARTAQSPRWPKTPVREGANVDARDISSPISMNSPSATDDPALLRRQLRNSEQRVAELERQFTNEKDLQTLNKKLLEKRKTVSVLDSQTDIMIRQLEVLAGYVERAKDSKQPLNIAELEDSAIKEFVQKLERLKQAMSGAVEALFEERNELLEEKDRIMADRDRALVEFEQLSSKNAQLADMNNDLTHQIQERFKAQSGQNVDGPRQPMNVLGIYTSHSKEKSNVSLHLDDASLRPSTSTTMLGSVGSYQQSGDPDSAIEPATVLSAPHVVNIRKGQAKKFNWKKGGQTVAKGVSKGFKGAFSSTERERQWAGQVGDSIGMPYNMTMTAVEAPAQPAGAQRSGTNDPSRQGFGLFKKGNALPKSFSNGNVAVAEAPSTLFGSDLVERADYERRQIPSVVTRCIEEVELRGMDIEGIYRKTGGSGQVKIIQEGFDKTEDFDISDPGLDITAVTSVLKQYFRKLPIPLLTFEVYDRVLESLCRFYLPA